MSSHSVRRKHQFDNTALIRTLKTFKKAEILNIRKCKVKFTYSIGSFLFIYLFIYLCIYLFMFLFIYLFICLFMYLLSYLFIYWVIYWLFFSQKSSSYREKPYGTEKLVYIFRIIEVHIMGKHFLNYCLKHGKSNYRESTLISLICNLKYCQLP